MEEKRNRESLGSRMGFIFLSAGCAIGLGNVWRFPYITGRYGGAAFVLLYLLFLYWVESFWGLLVLPLIFDAYITKRIKWGWWKELKNKTARKAMGWVDAIVFALVAVYFLNQFFFQNFVIPSSSLEKTMLTGDYLLVSKLSYGPRIPQTPLSMPLVQHTLPVLNCQSYINYPHWDYRRVKGFGRPELNDIVVFNYPSGDTVAANAQDQDFYRLVYQIGDQLLTQQGAMSQPFSATINGGQTYETQQAAFRRIYAAGRAFMEMNQGETGRIFETRRPQRELREALRRTSGTNVANT